MAPQSITRRLLLAAGFSRTPDVWLYCPRRRRHEYFERWHHSEWCVSYIPGYYSNDAAGISEDELDTLLSAHRRGMDLEHELAHIGCE